MAPESDPFLDWTRLWEETRKRRELVLEMSRQMIGVSAPPYMHDETGILAIEQPDGPAAPLDLAEISQFGKDGGRIQIMDFGMD